MNKLTKATIAAAAGVCLLLGTGGTLAYWNGSAQVATGAITAGNLKVAQPTAGTWTVTNGSGVTNASIADINTFRAVPGDVLTYTTNVTVTASGTNLKFKATTAAASIAPADSSKDADLKLATLLSTPANNSTTIGTITSAPAGAVFTGTGTNTVTLTSAVGTAPVTYTVPVVVKITWPWGTTGSDNNTMDGKVSFAQFAVAIEQVQP